MNFWAVFVWICSALFSAWLIHLYGNYRYLEGLREGLERSQRIKREADAYLYEQCAKSSVDTSEFMP